MSKNTGLVLAGLVAAGVGAYFLLSKKVPAGANTGGGTGGGGTGGGGTGGGGTGTPAQTFKVEDSVLVTGYYSTVVAGHIREVKGGGVFLVYIDNFGTDILATINMLSKA